MLERICVFCLLLFLLAGSAFGGILDNGYAMVGGGAFGTVDQVKTGDVKGFFSGSGLLPLYWENKIWARLGFSDLNNEVQVENYTGSIMIFSRKPEVDLINPYAFGSLNFTHNSDPDSTDAQKEDEFALDGGLGIVFPLVGGKWYIEVGYKNILGIDSFSIGTGLVFDLTKPAEKTGQ